ncbi:MAG: hypothetical protein WAZ27_01005 [Minisyncoccia bacterium]
MKWGIVIVAIIIGGSLFYFWSQSRPSEPIRPQRGTEMQIEATPKAPAEKYIPPGTIMEDGTL